MKRRDAIRIMPLSLAGLMSLPGAVLSMKNDSRPLCLKYFKRMKKLLTKIRNTESDNLLEAAFHIARTYKNGGTCYSLWDVGHSTGADMFPDRHGDPEIFTMGYPADRTSLFHVTG